MTLYGLDLVLDQEGKYHLLEVNGVCSGMKGFGKIYGDDRVEQQVYQMLQQRYGKITVNDGSYFRLEYKKKHPLKYRWAKFTAKFPFLGRKEKTPAVLLAPTARIDWLMEKIPVSHSRAFPFEPYTGQESGVLNLDNEELPHPLVNPYLTEAIANNKFYTYQVLKDSAIKDMIPKSTLLGLGFTHEQELEEILQTASQFVIKPILGSQGRGIEIIPKRVAQRQQGTRGPADFRVKSDLPFKLIPLYVEDMIDCNMFSFEHGLGMLQPFIDSRQNIGGEKMYTSIRSIVCNEQFVDAYVRASDNKKVNLSQGAQAFPLTEKDKEKIASLSEKIVAVFEEQSLGYEIPDFEPKMYLPYVESRGRTTLEMRRKDAQHELTNTVVGVFTHAIENMKI
ncbi:MAG TPA: hypothetical protein VJB13_05310 [Candidatus Nanoarchaeia archaeon]|nr:hypothetical protein [Candidatus Nanoarchaeia archaeon]